MRKISILSLVAVLAATPMMAEASNVTLVTETNNKVAEETNVASTSYVKGAYNVLGKAVNSKQDQLKAGDDNIQTAVKTATGTNAISALSSYDTASDSSLVTERAVLTAINSAVNGVGNDVTNVTNLIGNTDNLDGSAKGQSTIVGAINAKQDQLKAGDSEISTAVVQAANISSTIDSASDTALVTEKAVVTAAQNAASAAVGNKGIRVFTEWGEATSAVVALDTLPAQS